MIISTAKKVFAFHNTLFNSFIYVFSRLNLNFSTNHNFHYFPKRINNKNYNNNLSRYHLGHIHQQKVLMECSHSFGYICILPFLLFSSLKIRLSSFCYLFSPRMLAIVNLLRKFKKLRKVENYYDFWLKYKNIQIIK